MATFTDPTAFAHHISSYGAKLKAKERPATTAAANVAGVAVEAAGSRFRIKGRGRLGAEVENLGSTASVRATPPGPWALVEHGAKAHRIQSRRGRRGVVVVPGYGIFAHVQHPAIGPIGHPWEQAMVVAHRTAPKAFEAVIVMAFV